MIVALLGSPCSGKTTTAAKAFVALKEQGVIAEFITEQARWYIAEKRWNLKLKPQDRLELDETDQLAIMEKQFNAEQILKSSSTSSTVVISDSSALNALLYMTDAMTKSAAVNNLVEACLKAYDLVYYCKPLSFFPLGDANRLHDQAFALEADKKIPALVDRLGIRLADTIETPWERDNFALNILSRMAE